LNVFLARRRGEAAELLLPCHLPPLGGSTD
jgi:hypothetical protein